MSVIKERTKGKWRTGCNAGFDILTANALNGRMLVTPASTKVDLGLLINLTSTVLSPNRVCAWALLLRSHARVLHTETPQSRLIVSCIIIVVFDGQILLPFVVEVIT